MENTENKANNEYRMCKDCVHRYTESPCPCDSCDETMPTNFEEA